MLRLQRDARVRGVAATARAGERAVEQVARVDLEARLRAQAVQPPPAARLPQGRHPPWLPGRVGAQHPVVVVPAAGRRELRITGGEGLGQPARAAQVERRARDRGRRAVRDQLGVHRQVLVRLDPQEVLVDGATALARQVEVGVVRQVDHRRGVADGRVLDRELARTVQQIADVGRESPREALVPGRAAQAEPDAGPAAFARLGGLPEPGGEAVRAAVQGVSAGLTAQRVDGAVERQHAARDAVGVAAHGGPEVGGPAQQIAGGRRAEHEVGPAAVPVGGVQRVQPGAEGEHLHRDVLLRAEDPALDGPSVGQGEVGLAADRGGGHGRSGSSAGCTVGGALWGTVGGALWVHCGG